MIKLKLEYDDYFKKLANNLKKFREAVKVETYATLDDFIKNIQTTFEDCISKKVYEQYDPQNYDRTLHLAGRHGAVYEKYNHSRNKAYYKFSIDEDSKDPVDGTTWRVKANNVEQGKMRMKGGAFPRPFIEETQEELYDEMERLADKYVKNIERLLDRID